MESFREVLQLYSSILPLLLLVLGLCLGSFLNVVGLRVPLSQSIAFPPSRCPSCEHRLRPLDLVPVFGWLFLRGKCRYCQAPVSALYPLMEAATGLLFALMAWRLGATAELLPALLLVSILAAITVSDIRYMLIPNRIVFTGYALALLMRLFIHPLPLWSYIAGFLVGGGVLYALAWISVTFLKKEGMGGGDIKLFAFIGLVLGVKLTLLALFASSVIGLVYGIVLLSTGRFGREKMIPFGPFIAMGSIVTYLWGQDWWTAYTNMLG
ncbi:prepilin peptidase [Paenibacillus koleovorans]|uniref:prepilin peptidase n=1 Tax=Paenibacillus koleovorans TaxID=121608 RepID=UPI000FD98FAE|nr:A24 family peptidase [Paenibacillus koleovorans]